MSKSTYVGIKNEANIIERRKVINVWMQQNGVLVQKVIPKGLINGTIKKFMQYQTDIYNYGVETVRMSGSPNFNRRKDHLYVRDSGHFHILEHGFDEKSISTSISTDIGIELTGYNKVTIEYLGEKYTRMMLSISRSKNKGFSVGGSVNSDILTYTYISTGSRATASLDISKISGVNYIGISGFWSTNINGDSNTAETKLYKIILE